jgi:chromosome partitioning protein
MDRVLTTDEVAALLRKDRKTVQRWILAGKLQAAKVGRSYLIPESAITALVGSDVPAGGAAPRRCVTTAIVNHKGGVGKTTVTFNLAVALRKRGHRVLLVDTDPQGALTVSAGVSLAKTIGRSLYQVLLDSDLDPHERIIHTSSGCDLLPAELDLAGADAELVTVAGRDLILREALDRLRDEYDQIVIDTPPNLGMLTVNSLAAADRFIVPVVCEYLAALGLKYLLKTVGPVQRRVNRSLQFAGILASMYDGRTTHSSEILSELKDAFPGKVYDVVIRRSIRVAEAPAAGQSIIEYDPNHEISRAFARLAEEVDRG